MLAQIILENLHIFSDGKQPQIVRICDAAIGLILGARHDDAAGHQSQPKETVRGDQGPGAQNHGEKL